MSEKKILAKKTSHHPPPITFLIVQFKKIAYITDIFKLKFDTFTNLVNSGSQIYTRILAQITDLELFCLH